jgi:phosphoribosylaminoimidazolecarboxamide formyltransferase/IMP cyclohydrolase
MAGIERAIISVSDKTGIVEFAKVLNEMGVEILSTGGTAKKIKDAGVHVIEVSEYTGFPEMMDGRVKTLHPKIHGGILALRDNPEHMNALTEHGIKKIDMIVVNLYPFEQTISKPDVTFEEAIENIDIGGPTMIRAAAKNFKHVVVIVDPADYNTVLSEMKQQGGEVSYETRLRLAHKVFAHTSHYDGMIADYLKKIIQG